MNTNIKLVEKGLPKPSRVYLWEMTKEERERRLEEIRQELEDE